MIYIVDPLVVSDFGHNYHSCLRFSELFHKNNIENKFVFSKYFSKLLSKPNDKAINSINILNWPYNKNLLKILRLDFKIDKRSFLKKLITYGITPIRHIITRLLMVIIYYRFFKDYRISKNDKLFYPSTDSASIVSLYVMSLLKKKQMPIIHFRLIGVMEMSTKLSLLISIFLINHMIKRGVKIELSTETIKLRNFYQNIIKKNIDVVVIPNTLMSPFSQEKKENTKIRIGFLGSPRPDKGYKKLYSLITFLNANSIISNSCEFIAQLKKGPLTPYELSLVEIKNMILYPHFLHDDEYYPLLHSVDILILDYDSDVYKLRGSAVFFDGLVNNKMILYRKSLGFTIEAQLYGIGNDFSDYDELRDHMVVYLKANDKHKKVLRGDSKGFFENFNLVVKND
jgi:hypothetical protein